MNVEYDPYAELVKERSSLLTCDVCMYYPIEPVHGHFMCPSCHNVTKCCEGMPLEVAAKPEVKQQGRAGKKPAAAARKPRTGKGAKHA